VETFKANCLSSKNHRGYQIWARILGAWHQYLFTNSQEHSSCSCFLFSEFEKHRLDQVSKKQSKNHFYLSLGWDPEQAFKAYCLCFREIISSRFYHLVDRFAVTDWYCLDLLYFFYSNWVNIYAKQLTIRFLRHVYHWKKTCSFAQLNSNY